MNQVCETNSRLCQAVGILVVALGSTTLHSVFAAEAACTNPDSARAIYYGNGVNNTFLQASEGLIALGRALETDDQLTERDELKLAYNRTGGLLRDIAQALIQDLELTYTEAVRFAINPPGEEIENYIIRAVASFNQLLIRDEDLQRHLESYRSDMLTGKAVVLVAHSQGNFYANQVWNRLTTQERTSFAIVSVANPDNAVGGQSCLELAANVLPGGTVVEVLACAVDADVPDFAWLGCIPETPRYTTGCGDNIIQGLRLLYNTVDGSATFDYLPRALPANVNSPLLEAEDRRGHSFTGTYLSVGSQTRASILENVRASVASLVEPEFTGDLSLTGTVIAADSQAPIESARVQVQLIGDSTFDAVIRDVTDESGAYALCVQSDLIPDNFLVAATREGYVPLTESVTQDGSSLQLIDLTLSPQTEDIVVIEVDPIVHHLGDDNFNGQINGQFQRRSEGSLYQATFVLSDAQFAAQAAELVFYAKGVQADNPVSINEQLVGTIPQSPADGSFSEVTLDVPMALFDQASELQLIEIESVRSSSSFFSRDIDDFEFANLRLRFTL